MHWLGEKTWILMQNMKLSELTCNTIDRWVETPDWLDLGDLYAYFFPSKSLGHHRKLDYWIQNLKPLKDRYKKHDYTYQTKSCDCVLCDHESSCYDSDSLHFSVQMAHWSSGYDWGDSWHRSDKCLSKSTYTRAGLDTPSHCDSGLCCSMCKPAFRTQTTRQMLHSTLRFLLFYISKLVPSAKPHDSLVFLLEHQAV